MIPAAVTDSWLFWLAIIDGLAAAYILPTVIAIARQVEGLGLVIYLNTIPIGWPAALILACLIHARRSATLLSASGHAGSSGRRRGVGGTVAADGTAIAENDHLGVYRMARDEPTDLRGHLPAVSSDVPDEVPGDPIAWCWPPPRRSRSRRSRSGGHAASGVLAWSPMSSDCP